MDGYYTGDIGKFEKNYLIITDRKKDILITPGGDNISPLKIENLLTSSVMIDQAIVYGDNKPYLVALIIINKEFQNKKENLKKEIENINKNLTKVEKIKKYFIIKENFTIENGMMTPTLKLKDLKLLTSIKMILKIYIKNYLKLIANYLTFLNLIKFIKLNFNFNFFSKKN